MVVSVVSIPHTGTRFTEHTVRVLGFTTRYAQFHPEEAVTHALGGNRDQMRRAVEWLEGTGKVVVPWRHPDLVRASWANRGKEPPRFTPPTDAEFARLLAYTERDNVHLFHVSVCDCDRGKEVSALAEFLECAPKAISWEPIGSEPDRTGLKAAYYAGAA